MIADRISLPHVEASIFESRDANGIENALAKCESAGCQPAYMNELPGFIDLNLFLGNFNLCRDWFTTVSVAVTGWTPGGNPVRVYGHVPNYFSESSNIKKACEKGLVNGAGEFSLGEFYDLLDLEDGENVFVVDHGLLRNSESGLIEISKALKHPQTIPFFGGKDKAELLLERYAKYSDFIDVQLNDDLADLPLARLLSFNSPYGNSLNNYGCFIGLGQANVQN